MTTLEDQTRAALDRLTDDVEGGPSLTAAVSAGRRRRRRTGLVAGAAALALAGGVGTVAVQQLHGPPQPVAVGGFAAQPSYRDFVPGTQVDEVMQAAVADHLPTTPGADKVYPSDWNRNTPLPDGQELNATDWEAYYTLSAREGLVVSMFQPIPGEPATTTCDSGSETPPCTRTVLADGSVLLHSGLQLGTTYRLTTVLVSPQGFVVQAFDDVQADSWTAAEAGATLPQGGLDALVEDHSLTFPEPVVEPAPPTDGS